MRTGQTSEPRPHGRGSDRPSPLARTLAHSNGGLFGPEILHQPLQVQLTEGLGEWLASLLVPAHLAVVVALHRRPVGPRVGPERRAIGRRLEVALGRLLDVDREPMAEVKGPQEVDDLPSLAERVLRRVLEPRNR